MYKLLTNGCCDVFVDPFRYVISRFSKLYQLCLLSISMMEILFRSLRWIHGYVREAHFENTPDIFR